jgi:hypothetical protein
MIPFSVMRKSKLYHGIDVYYYWCQENTCAWGWDAQSYRLRPEEDSELQE